MIEKVKYQSIYEKIDSQNSQEINSQKHNQGVWSQEEVLKFMIFSHYNINVLTSRLQRRTNKIFKEMALFIGTRSSTQCRSQNQKFLKKHKNIKRIIKKFEIQIGEKQFEESCVQYKDQLKALCKGRKKNESVQNRNKISIFTQTEFSSSSSQEQKQLVKMEEQINQKQEFDENFFPFFPMYGDLHRTNQKNKIE